jgi:hypothetical protein
MKRYYKFMLVMVAIFISVTAFSLATSAGGDVAGAVTNTWKSASTQIKTVLNNVVFPVIDVILGVFFFVKLAMSYFSYQKHGSFEWQAPAILFVCLVLALTAPTYVWGIVGI